MGGTGPRVVTVQCHPTPALLSQEGTGAFLGGEQLSATVTQPPLCSTSYLHSPVVMLWYLMAHKALFHLLNIHPHCAA